MRIPTENRPQGQKETFYEDSSVLAANTGLTVADMTAAVISGSSVSVTDVYFDTATSELSYRVNFDQRGTSIVETTTTFTGSDEVIKNLYRYQTINATGYSNDYV